MDSVGVYSAALRRALAAISTFALVAGLAISFATPAYAAGGQIGSLQGFVVDQKSQAPITGAVTRILVSPATLAPSGRTALRRATAT